MKLEIKSGIKRVKRVDRYGQPGDVLQPVVEVWIDGICCYHECNTPEEARALVIRITYALGIDK